MRKIITLILTCALLISCLSGCAIVDKILGRDEPVETKPPVNNNTDDNTNEYNPEDQFLCEIDHCKYYMHTKVSEIPIPEASNRVLAYLSRNDNGASRYKEYEDFSETTVHAGDSAVVYLYNYLSEGVSAVISVYNNTSKSVPIGECRINGMVVYRAHLSSQNISFNGFEFSDTLSIIEGFMGKYDYSITSMDGSYYQYSWDQTGHLDYSMTAHVYKNTGKIMSISFITRDIMDESGKIISSGVVDDPDVEPTTPDSTEPSEPGIQEAVLVLNTGDLRVYLEEVVNVNGYPKLVFFVENLTGETFNFVIDDIYAGKRVVDTSAWIIDAIPAHSERLVEFYVKSDDFEGKVDLKKDTTLILDVILDSSMRKEQKSGFRIDISDLAE